MMLGLSSPKNQKISLSRCQPFLSRGQCSTLPHLGDGTGRQIGRQVQGVVVLRGGVGQRKGSGREDERREIQRYIH